MPGTARRILTHPHEALRRKARPVERFGPSLVALGDDLLATLYACGGLGIAAPQVDVAGPITYSISSSASCGAAGGAAGGVSSIAMTGGGTGWGARQRHLGGASGGAGLRKRPVRPHQTHRPLRH